MIHVLLFSTLYPNANNTQHGVFVETRVKKLVETSKVKVTVVAPVPWFPFKSKVFGRYAAFAGLPQYEVWNGISVYRPRYLVIPKIWTALTPWFLSAAFSSVLSKLRVQGNIFDIIDAHYYFPDGVAAAKVASKVGLPVIITAHGSDINVLPNYKVPRQQIRTAASTAAFSVAVSEALRVKMLHLGMKAARVKTLQNCVDLDVFTPTELQEARSRLGVVGKVVCFAGNLVSLKGVDIIISSIAETEGVTLLIAGDGPLRRKLEDQAEELGVSDRVRFLGRLQQKELVDVFSASDALIMASEREGWPSVLLEAMACGARVIAVPVGGVPEIVNRPEAGVLVEDRTPEALTRAIEKFYSKPDNVSRANVIAYARQFDWSNTINRQIELYNLALSHDQQRSN